MKFSEFIYERPDIDKLCGSLDSLIDRFREANTADEQVALIQEIYRLRTHFETMSNLAYVRYTINTNDPFYRQEQAFFDEHSPMVHQHVQAFYKALLSSKFRSELASRFGQHLLRLAQMQLQVFTPDIVTDLQTENALITQYTNLIASAQIEFRGQIYNLAGLNPFKQSTDRSVRREAHDRSDAFFAANETEFDRLYDELVRVRHAIATKLGFTHFVPVGYLRMNRSDYTAEDVARLRDFIAMSVVPVAATLKARQRMRLSLDRLYYYDEPLMFAGGNPQPHGNPEWIIARAQQMYDELSAETGTFFRMMREQELMDLVTRPQKASGGYCTFLSGYSVPFIFSNFNGTSDDIDVLTHEVGHAFQAYCSRFWGVEEYYFPTSEAAEIHSMSMELLTWPWMDYFFLDRADHYRFVHLTRTVLFLPYGAAVDEFQHWVYEHPTASPLQRKAFWRQLEEKYLPYRNYQGNDYLERGGFWHRQAHIFKHPFYYIDYVLAQFCAYQFWQRAMQNRQQTMEDFIKLCQLGGSLSFRELLSCVELDNPLDPAACAHALEPVGRWLNAIDDTRLNAMTV